MSSSEQKLYRDPNLQIVFGITLVTVMGVASITPAFPKIVKELAISSKQVGLLITVFTLPGVILTPVLGILADRHGRKKVLIPSLFLFGIAGGSCAFVRDFNLLLLCRFFQGMGASSLGSLYVTIIGDLYSGKQRTEALSYNTSILSIGTASYPSIGGGLALFGWYYPFLLPLAAIPLGLIAAFGLKNPEPTSREDLKDYLRSAWHQVSNRHVIGLFTAGLGTFIILYGAYLTFFPLLLGDSYGASTFVIGLIMSSMSVSTAITSSRINFLTRFFTDRFLLKAAFVLYALSLVMIPLGHSLWIFLIPAMVFGMAQGINIPVILDMLTASAPLENRAAFMSINGLILRLGQTTGPVIMGGFFHIWGMPGVFYAAACFSLLMIIVLVFLIR